MSGSYRIHEEKRKEEERQKAKKRQEDLELSAKVYAQNRDYFLNRDKEWRARNAERNRERIRAQEAAKRKEEAAAIIGAAVCLVLLILIVVGVILGAKLSLTMPQAIVFIWGVAVIPIGTLIYLRDKGIQELRPLGTLAFYCGIIVAVAFLITIGWFFGRNLG